MPQIAELREIDGAIWARIELPEGETQMSLVVGSEMAEIKRQERLMCAEIAEEAADKYATKIGNSFTIGFQAACEQIAADIRNAR